MSGPILDTHAWIWWVHGDERLGRGVIDALDELAPDDRPSIADISLWEAATLVSRGRLDLEMTFARWLELAADARTVRILPITPDVAIELARLGDSIHRDPADRLIIASSRAYGLPLVTRDEAIQKTGLVKLWKPRVQPQLDSRSRLPRLFELRDALTEPGHVDAYFRDFEARLKIDHIFDQYARLERYLSALDDAAWRDLRTRAARKLIARQRQEGRGWQDLFDVLNEAIAYAYLHARGADGIRFLPAGAAVRSPDLAATLNGISLICEVKTVNKSEQQADHDRRVAEGEVFVSDAITELPERWIVKLRQKIGDALDQLHSAASDDSIRIIFIAVNFDDRGGDYHDRYFAQIDEALDAVDLDGAELVLYPTTNAFERTYVMRNATVYLG